MSQPQQPYEPPSWDPDRAAQPPTQPGYQPPGYQPPPSAPGYQPPPSYQQQPQGPQPATPYQQSPYQPYGINAPTPPGQVEPGAPGAWPVPPQGQPGVGQTASAGVRLAGYLIDAVLLAIFNGIINGIFPGPVTYVGDVAITSQSTFAWLLTTGASLAYFAYLNGQGQTIGKRIMRTKVVDATTGQPIGTQRAAIRWVVQVLMSIPLMLGWLSVPLSPDTRGFHDRAANDRVIRV